MKIFNPNSVLNILIVVLIARGSSEQIFAQSDDRSLWKKMLYMKVNPT